MTARAPGIHPGDIVDLGQCALNGPTLGRPCPMCGRTYGLALPDHPDRCGVCLTGLSLDGMPVHPDPVTLLDPIGGAPVLRLPGGIYAHNMTETSRALGLDPSPVAVFAGAVRGRLKDWPGYRQLLIDEGIDPATYERKEVR